MVASNMGAVMQYPKINDGDLISLDGVHVIVLRGIDGDSFELYANAIIEANPNKIPLAILLLNEDETIEAFDEESMKAVGWCRCDNSS